MAMTPPRARILPATIVAMALLLATKSVGLFELAVAANAATKQGPAAAAAKPVDSAGAVPARTAEAPPPAAVASPAAPPVSPPVSAPVSALGASTAPLSANPAAPVSDSERNLLLDLRHRRDTLDSRERAQEQRDQVTAAAEKQISARVAELNTLQTKLEVLEAARQSHDSANWTSLVHIYETMKPRDAATIFDALDMQVLLGVLDRMSERKAAPILAAMQPERARLATQLLAELRTRAVTPAGETPAGLASGDKASPLAPDPKG